MDTPNALEGKSSPPSLLVVSQDLGTRRTVRAWMELEGWMVSEIGSSRAPISADHHVVLVDAAGESQLDEVLAHRAMLFRGAPVVVLATEDDRDPAGQSDRLLRAGAHDVVGRPLDRPRLSLALGRGLEVRRLALRLRELEGLVAGQSAATSASPVGPEVVPLAELERRAIRHALIVTRGNVSEAARLLGVGRSTLYRHLSPEQVAEARPMGVRPAAVAALR